MLQLISGLHVSRALFVAAKLGLADLVAAGTHELDALAQVSQTDAASLLRLLRLLATVGVFAIDARGLIQLTPLAQTLQRDAPASLQAWAVGQLGDEQDTLAREILGEGPVGGERCCRALHSAEPPTVRL